jgi:hypothetical protein
MERAIEGPENPRQSVPRWLSTAILPGVPGPGAPALDCRRAVRHAPTAPRWSPTYRAVRPIRPETTPTCVDSAAFQRPRVPPLRMGGTRWHVDGSYADCRNYNALPHPVRLCPDVYPDLQANLPRPINWASTASSMTKSSTTPPCQPMTSPTDGTHQVKPRRIAANPRCSECKTGGMFHPAHPHGPCNLTLDGGDTPPVQRTPAAEG